MYLCVAKYEEVYSFLASNHLISGRDRKEPDGGDAKPNVGAAAVAAAAAAAPVRRRSMSSLVQGRAYSEKDEKVLKIAASDVAAITGFHEWVDVRELFLERLLYQVRLL